MKSIYNKPCENLGEDIILFVDDEDSVTKSLKRVFNGAEYRIITANNGEKGLEYIRDKKIKLVISDYRMPGMNGVEFMERVCEISPETVRILLTGYADIAIAASAINRGHVYKFIEKPWNVELLETDVRRGIEYYDLLQERKELYDELVIKNAELDNMNRNLEKLVEERTRQLLHSEKMATLGQMAGQIGHEINNVLTLLQGRLHLAGIKKNDSGYIEDTLFQFSKLIDRMGIHTKNLLSFGKPVPPEFKDIILNETIENTVKNLIDAGVLKYYKISKEYHNSLPHIYGDMNQLDQVFTNLFMNAHHAMEENGELFIVTIISDNSKYIEVHVRDTGKGINKKHIDKIFDPFFTTKPEGKGTGLGLPVVKKIVESHKGYINVKSEENVGTTMIVGFPSAEKK